MLHELLPEDAEINGPLTEVVVLMDGDMETEVGLDAANWQIAFGGVLYTIVAVATDGREVTIDVIATLVPHAPDGVTFSPPPFDLLGTDGGTAAAFADFPIHA